MMGSNTFCLELCYEDYSIYAEKHRQEVLTALLYIKEHLPRTIVNLILSPSKWKKQKIILLKLNTWKSIQWRGSGGERGFSWKNKVHLNKIT